MTYKFQVRLQAGWSLETADGTAFAFDEVLRLLAAVDVAGHIAGACKACKVSYRHAWGLLRRAETEFGQPLLQTSRRQGSTLTRFAHQLLLTKKRIDARLEPTLASMGAEVQEELASLYRPAACLRLHASHGFAVEGLMQMVKSLDSSPIELRYRTAIEAVTALGEGECDIAGFQVPVGRYEAPVLQQYLPLLNAEQHAFIYLAQRKTGLFVQPGNPVNIQGITDLARAEVRLVNRQAGSGSRVLLSLMLENHNIDPAQVRGYDSSEFTHMAVAAHVASGMADVGIGVETAAWRCGLDFIPLVQERYFFAVQRDRLASPAMQQLFDLLMGEGYQQFLKQLVGYDARGAGKVLSLDEAFGPSRTLTDAYFDSSAVLS